MTKFGKITTFGIITVLIVGIFIFWVSGGAILDLFNPVEREMKEQMRISGRATEVLRGLVSVADNLSGVTEGAAFPFEVVNMDGRSTNFGIYKSDGVTGRERLVEEHMVIFQEVGSRTVNASEVDVATNRVISMHRTPVNFGDMKISPELEKIVRQFLERVDPDFIRIESTLTNQYTIQDDPDGGTYFFRWNDKRFALPDGLEMDLNPFIQVGINSSGFIFSYDNTVQFYSNLSRETLRAICSFVEIPQTDDSSLDPEKGTVIVWFYDYDKDQTKYLILPYEPETDFEGCSESAKTYLRHLPNPSDQN